MAYAVPEDDRGAGKNRKRYMKKIFTGEFRAKAGL